MAQAAHQNAHGGMDIADQKNTFTGFLHAALWGSALIIMLVALLTFAFAMNLGWFAGLGAFAVIGAGVGLLFRMSGAWGTMLSALVVARGAGGSVFPLIFSLAS